MSEKIFYWTKSQSFEHSLVIDDISLEKYFNQVGETVAHYSLANGYLQEYHDIYLHQIPPNTRKEIVKFIRKKYEKFLEKP